MRDRLKTIPFRFAASTLDNAVDGLKYKESAENSQRPEVVSTGDASRSPDGEHGVYEEQKTSKDCLDSPQHLAETDSLHPVLASHRTICASIDIIVV